MILVIEKKKLIFKGIFIRFAIKWFENGDYIQAAADQRAADHLPPLLPPAADVLRHHILQTFLLWGRSDSQPVHTSGDHHSLHKVNKQDKLPVHGCGK